MIERQVMKANKGSLGPHETVLIIQSQIERLTPQQVLIRDEMVSEGILIESTATSVVKGERTLEEAKEFEARVCHAFIAGTKAIAELAQKNGIAEHEATLILTAWNKKAV